MKQQMEMNIPTTYKTLYRELQSIPMYKTEQGYRFAAFLLQNTEQSTMLSDFLSNEDAIPDDLTAGTATHGRQLFQQAVDRLSDLLITDEALVGWQTFQKEMGDVETYHRIFLELYESLFLEQFQEHLKPQRSKDLIEIKLETEDKKQIKIQDDLMDIPDFQNKWETSNKQPISSEIVLNHNNPFADISIKEQSFIYGSVLGQFESLGLTTSHTLTKVQKDTERSYLALQPGFKIKRSKHIEKNAKQDVIFDDTLTTEIAQNDENIYVYIN